MSAKEWSLIFSFIAMLLIASAYFFKSKGMFLTMQGAGICGLMASYLCNGQYFAMLGLGIGLVRCIVFYLYEKKEREAPILWCYGLCAASFAVYGIVNLWMLQAFHPADIVYLVGLVLYMFIFRIRNIKTVRFTIFIPTGLSIVYNVWAASPIFAVISYCIEMLANIVSIFKYHVFRKETAMEAIESVAVAESTENTENLEK